jgi:hypothetical protein
VIETSVGRALRRGIRRTIAYRQDQTCRDGIALLDPRRYPRRQRVLLLAGG